MEESHNDILFRKALEAIDALFSDVSVSVEVARRNMRSLIDECAIRLEALEE